ncbi:MAG: glycerate kinase type-2 family protein [Nitrosotalea sp.]
MIIQNFKQLATGTEKKLTLDIIEKGLSGALPYNALEKVVKQDFLQVGQKKMSVKKYHRVYVVAVGKAADSMTKAVNLLTRVHGGIVVIPDNTPSLIRTRKFTVIQSGHPIPTKKSVIAARRVIDFLKSLETTDLVVFLISGGASSLLSLPDGISLKDKQLVTDLLLKSGANIPEINCVRKHLSKIKGGRLVESLRCTAVSFVMSDVVGNDLSVIASGMTYCDRSTFSDAKRTLLKYGLKNRTPKSVWNRIILGTTCIIPETPKKPKIYNCIISTNKNCVDLMRIHAQKLGFATKMIYPIEGDVKDAASKISRHFFGGSHSCLIFGGETTVTVQGKGKGGRNQELVLHLLKKLKDRKENLVIASIGTDGIDGNTNAAGAIADSTMLSTTVDQYLHKNNAYCYFENYGGLIFTGPTHTNLMDVGLILQQ